MGNSLNSCFVQSTHIRLQILIPSFTLRIWAGAPSRRPFLVARRKEGWLIPTRPNTGLPHLSLLTLSKKTPASLLVLDLERLLPAAARQPGQWPCVCTWSLSPDSWKEAEEQRPLVSLSLDDEEGGDDFSVCMS